MAGAVRTGSQLVWQSVAVAVPLLGSACGPKTAEPDGLCGTAVVPDEASCGNGKEDAGELCLTRMSVPLGDASSFFFVLDVDGDDALDVLTHAGFRNLLWRGRGDGSFQEAEDISLDGDSFVDAPEGMRFDFLAGSSSGDDISLLGYVAESDGTFTRTYLHTGRAEQTVVTSLGVGGMDERGATRVSVGLDHVESGGFYMSHYSVRGDTASETPLDIAAPGQPSFVATEAEGIWIADFDQDGYEDHLAIAYAYEFARFDGTRWVKRRVTGDGAFFNQLRWLVDAGAVDCSTLDAFNLTFPLQVDVHRVDDDLPEDETWSGLAVARVNADDALDLVFAKADGTYVALGSLAEPMEPLDPDPDQTDWLDIDIRDHPFQHIEKISDATWQRAKVVDLDADGTPDLVGADETSLQIMLGDR